MPGVYVRNSDVVLDVELSVRGFKESSFSSDFNDSKDFCYGGPSSCVRKTHIQECGVERGQFEASDDFVLA